MPFRMVVGRVLPKNGVYWWYRSTGRDKFWGNGVAQCNVHETRLLPKLFWDSLFLYEFPLCVTVQLSASVGHPESSAPTSAAAAIGHPELLSPTTAAASVSHPESSALTLAPTAAAILCVTDMVQEMTPN